MEMTAGYGFLLILVFVVTCYASGKKTNRAAAERNARSAAAKRKRMANLRY